MSGWVSATQSTHIFLLHLVEERYSRKREYPLLLPLLLLLYLHLSVFLSTMQSKPFQPSGGRSKRRRALSHCVLCEGEIKLPVRNIGSFFSENVRSALSAEKPFSILGRLGVKVCCCLSLYVLSYVHWCDAE